MLNLSNSLSLLRAPLAFVLLIDNPAVRLLAILLAMFTDSIDGYFARRYHTTSRIGAILDPAMDKFFVFFALGVFFFEGRLELWQALTMISRDFALCLFGVYLSVSGAWQNFELKAIRWGKVTTALQFVVLSAFCLNFQFPSYVYTVFVIFGFLAFYELLQFKPKPTRNLP
jgi:CDP-diacylglycerol--glycerol-3-phosphate 3-phosphatidyltransferase